MAYEQVRSFCGWRVLSSLLFSFVTLNSDPSGKLPMSEVLEEAVTSKYSCISGMDCSNIRDLISEGLMIS